MSYTIKQELHMVSTPTKKAVGGLIGILALSLVINLLLYLQPVRAEVQPSSNEAYLMTAVNHERVNHGLKPLRYSIQLGEAAHAKAVDMLARGYFEHISPSGKTPWDFIDAAGYSYLKAGENLAIDFPVIVGSQGPVPAWMASQTHRANVLKADYEDAGVAVVMGESQGRKTTVVVQEFGTKPFSLGELFK